MARVWYVKHGSNPEFVKWDTISGTFDESLAISPNHFTFYNLNKSTPNPYVAKFGYIFSNLPGDVVVVYENDDGMADISIDFEKDLPAILEDDYEKRRSFESSFNMLGATVINF